jgi:hypothetical protein
VQSLALEWRKLLSLVDDAADATLYHAGKVPMSIDTRPFSVKGILQMLCGDMATEGRIASGVLCTVALGIGHSNEMSWSAAYSKVPLFCLCAISKFCGVSSCLLLDLILGSLSGASCMIWIG